LARSSAPQGRLDAALGTYQQALEVAAPPAQPALPDAGLAQVGMAEVAYQRGELDAALEHLSEGIAPCRQLVYTPPLATGLATLAWIRQANGDPAGAIQAIEQAERVTPSRGVTTLLNPVPALRARLLLAHGDVAAADRWAQSSAALAPTTSPAIPGSRSIWCWRACCSPRTAPTRRSRCWSECTPKRRRRADWAA
jgi:LuxR family maltose regulon positive regulatory protein